MTTQCTNPSCRGTGCPHCDPGMRQFLSLDTPGRIAWRQETARQLRTFFAQLRAARGQPQPRQLAAGMRSGAGAGCPQCATSPGDEAAVRFYACVFGEEPGAKCAPQSPGSSQASDDSPGLSARTTTTEGVTPMSRRPSPRMIALARRRVKEARESGDLLELATAVSTGYAAVEEQERQDLIRTLRGMPAVSRYFPEGSLQLLSRDELKRLIDRCINQRLASSYLEEVSGGRMRSCTGGVNVFEVKRALAIIRMREQGASMGGGRR